MVKQVEHFKDMDLEYVQWCENHPAGYVLNVFSSSNPIKIHRVNCFTLKMDKGKRTSLEKYCSVHYDELENIARSIRDWATCRNCM